MRTAFLFDLFYKYGGKFHFIWIYPLGNGIGRVQYLKDTLGEDKFESLDLIDDSIKKFFSTKIQVRQLLINYDPDQIVAIGFSSLSYLPSSLKKPIIWCVNGIPEEDVLTNSWYGPLVQLKWFITRQKRADLIICVSERMKAYLKSNFKKSRIIVAPCCVDTSLYFKHRKPVDRRVFFSYLGSGAPWQNIKRISSIWKAIHEADKNITFRVISGDNRCKILAEGIDPDHIEFRHSGIFEEVAAWQSECTVGFLIRNDHIVNSVSFPMKLGEYLAAGSWVVASNLDWDISHFIKENKCGILIDNGKSDTENAKEILDFHKTVIREKMDHLTYEAASALDRTYWVNQTCESIIEHFNRVQSS